MNDDWFAFAQDIGKGLIAGVILACVILGPAIYFGRI